MPVVEVWLWALQKPWFQRYLGRKLTVINGEKGPAVGPIETMVPGLPGQVPELPGQKVNRD